MITLKEIFRRLPSDGKVRHILRQFNLAPKTNARAASVKKLAEDLGFDVQRKRLPKGMAGRLVPDPFSDNGYCIEVNEADSIQRQRWTVLHEIGHYFLHTNDNLPFAPEKLRERGAINGIAPFYSFEEDIEEREADEFAAALLFDGGALAAAFSLLGGDEIKLAKHFGVSPNAIKIAVRQFGLR